MLARGRVVAEHLELNDSSFKLAAQARGGQPRLLASDSRDVFGAISQPLRDQSQCMRTHGVVTHRR
jgi:hypothetical protein